MRGLEFGDEVSTVSFRDGESLKVSEQNAVARTGTLTTAEKWTAAEAR